MTLSASGHDKSPLEGNDHFESGRFSDMSSLSIILQLSFFFSCFIVHFNVEPLNSRLDPRNFSKLKDLRGQAPKSVQRKSLTLRPITISC